MRAEHPYFRIIAEDFAGHGRKFSKKANQTYTIGGLVGFEIGVGTIRPMQAGDKILGICKESITSAHTDYANTNPINVEIMFRGAEVYCPLSTAGAALTELGDELDVVNGGLQLTITESNNDFRSIALVGSETSAIFAVPQTTVY